MDFWIASEKRKAVNEAEASGEVADSMEVRKALIAKLHSGEMTLNEVQAELRRIKRNAGKNGKLTRAQAWKRG